MTNDQWIGTCSLTRNLSSHHWSFIYHSRSVQSWSNKAKQASPKEGGSKLPHSKTPTDPRIRSLGGVNPFTINPPGSTIGNVQREGEISMNEIERRKFIVNGAGAALGLSVLGKRGFSASPNGTIRVAVVGVNGRGTDHLSGFTPLKGVEVAGICDIDESVLNKRLGEYEKKNGKRPKGYNDMRRVFDDKEIDVVSFATPNHWHSLGTIWACQ